MSDPVVNITPPEEPIINLTVEGDPVVSISSTESTVTVSEGDSIQTINIGVIGPQGPQGEVGPAGPQGPPGESASRLELLEDVNAVGKVNKSVLVYDEPTGKFVVNAVHTVATLTDGGNF
jgi:hypothetical protein